MCSSRSWGESRTAVASCENCAVKRPQKFTVLIERDEEGYYIATVPALRGCHTQAKTLDRLMKRVHEVIELCLENGDSRVPSLELVGIQQVSIGAAYLD